MLSSANNLIDNLAERLFKMSIYEPIFKIGLKYERWKAERYAACKILKELGEQGMSLEESFSKAEPIVIERLDYYKAYRVIN